MIFGQSAPSHNLVELHNITLFIMYNFLPYNNTITFKTVLNIRRTSSVSSVANMNGMAMGRLFHPVCAMVYIRLNVPSVERWEYYITVRTQLRYRFHLTARFKMLSACLSHLAPLTASTRTTSHVVAKPCELLVMTSIYVKTATI